MAPQHQIRPLAHQEPGQFGLMAVGGVLVLHPPVDHHGDQVSLQGPGGGQVGGQQPVIRVGQGGIIVQVEEIGGVHLVRIQAEAVEAVGVGQKGHGDAPRVRHIDAAVLIPLLPGAVGAHMGQAGAVQHVQGAEDALQPPVQAVVVGGGQQMEPRLPQIIGQGVRGVEGGVAGVVRAAGQHRLQIGHGVVRPGQLVCSVRQDMAVVVVPRLRHIGVVGDGHVAHHVPGHHQAGHNGLWIRLWLGGRFRLGLGGGQGGRLSVGLRRLFPAAAAGEKQGQAQGQG